MFAGIGTNGALVHILVTRPSGEARWTGADGPAAHRVCVTDSILMAGIADTGIIQMTQEACLAHGAGTIERGYTVMAGSPVEAHGCGTVIDVLTAALARPAVDAHTAVATQQVEAGAPIVAGIGLQLTLIHILCAELACPLRRALAVVSVDTVHARSPIEAPMSRTVIHVDFAVLALEARKASTVIGGITTLPTGATVPTWGRGTGHRRVLTQQPCVAKWAQAAEGARSVEAGTAVAAGPTRSALIYVTPAAATLVARRTGTDEAAVRPH